MSTIEVPRLIPNSWRWLLGLFLAVLALAITVATFLVDDTPLGTRIVIVAASSAILPSLYVLWFLYRWLNAHRRRSLAYPRLERSLQDEQAERASLAERVAVLERSLHNEQAERVGLAARVALALGLAPLPASKLVTQGGSIKLLLPVARQAGLEIDDVLLLVDQRGAIARAEVDALDTTRAEASLTWFADPVAEGWFMKNIGPLGFDLPLGTHVLSESALSRRLEQLAQEEGTDG